MDGSAVGKQEISPKIPLITKLQSVLPDQLRNPHTRRDFLVKLRDYSIAGFFGAGFANDTVVSLMASTTVEKLTAKSLTEEQIRERLHTYHPEKPIKVKGKNLQQVGVAHHAENYLAHEEDIRQKVQASPKFVVLEYFDEEIAKNALPSSPQPKAEEPSSVNFNRVAKAFFSGIGKIAAEEGKDILVVNPQTDYSSIIDALGVPGLTGVVLYKDYTNLKNEAKTPMSRRRIILRRNPAVRYNDGNDTNDKNYSCLGAI